VNPARLDGKVAFVAGASRGIGRDIAVALANAGASVAVAARSETEGKLPGTIHSVAQRINDGGGRAAPIVCDVTSEESVAAAVESAVDQLGGLNIVVISAGVMWLAPTLQTSLKRWELCLRVNLTGVFLVTRASLPHVRTGEGGSLIAITTTGAATSELGANAYWVSKAGVERYYRGLAVELRPDNVAVNCLAPSKVVLTEGWAAAGDRILPPDMVEPPEFMARAAVLLAAQDGHGITGTVQYSQQLLGVPGADPPATHPD
jgi:citronellol/citronellal dehydrogenase